MNWPPLTEAWASAYLQILIGLLVFALGIPAFIFQLIVREDIRHVTARRMKTSLYWSSIVFLILAALAFVWFLHPKESDPDDSWKGRLAAALVTIVPIFVGVSSAYRLNYYRREKLIKTIKEDLLKKCHRREWATRAFEHSNRLVRRGLRRFAGKPLIDEELLRDLIHLGSHSKAGHEKELVLDALLEVAETVQQSGRYAGDDLKDLIQSLDEVVLCGGIAGNDKNFCTAADILEIILVNLKRNAQPSRSPDDANAVRITLVSLGIEAVKSTADPTVEKLLDLASSFNSEVVFKMGVAAFHAKRFSIAAKALHALEAAVERAGGLPRNDVTFRLFGLMAYFVVSGRSARKRAERFFPRLPLSSYDLVSDCLRQALDYFWRQADYETADHLDVLLHLAESQVWSPGCPFPNLAGAKLLEAPAPRTKIRPPTKARRPTRYFAR